jgi:uncharacterized protein YidB (DUF937 family)
MGVLDNIFGSGSTTAVPGGNLAKPIIIALLGVMASRALSGSKSTAAPGAPSNPVPTPSNQGSMPGAQPAASQDLSLGGVLGGLGGLLESFKRSGQGDVINSWVGTGANKSISPAQLTDALGADTLNQLSSQTGLSTQDLTNQLSQALPQVVDKLSPEGRLPDEQELSKMLKL